MFRIELRHLLDEFVEGVQESCELERVKVGMNIGGDSFDLECNEVMIKRRLAYRKRHRSNDSEKI